MRAERSPMARRLRVILLLVTVTCVALGVVGFLYGRWLMKHPPRPEETRGH